VTNAVGSVPGNLIDWAAGVIGVPPAVVSAQINDESGGDPAAVSPAGAQGVAQFEPGTWSGLGCGGSPWYVNDAMSCYAKYMYQLMQQFGGNVHDALAAYNAGPGKIAAGSGYADQILSASGQSQGLLASGGTGQPGTGQPGTSTPGQGTAACAWSVGGQHIGILFGHGPSLPTACLITKTEIRAVMGGLLLGVGALLALPGLVIIAAAGLKTTGIGQKATQAAGMVPGYGQAARLATGAGRAAGGTAAARPSRPGQGLTAAETRRAQANRRALEGDRRREAATTRAARPRPAAGRYRVTERTPLSGEMGGTRTVSYSTSRRPSARRGPQSA